VVVLAIDVSPAGSAPPAAATPTLSPPPGSFTSPQSVTLADTTPGAVIYYTTNGTVPTLNSSLYTHGTPLPISSTTTLEAIAIASGYSNSAVSGGTYTIGSQGTNPVSVNLGPIDNVDGIAASGSATLNGGLDIDGYAYSAALLGTSISWGGSTFTLGAAGIADAVSSTTIALPVGNDSTLNILATAVNGAQTAQSFVVTYTDGTTSTFKQNLSDWFYPQNFAGESQVLKMAYRIAPSGATSAGPVYLYGYSFALNSAKTVQSITLPNNRYVVVLAIDLTP
ncbi:MAG: chitobiase/beta-hexosaminidase C-terminal domain-containing protein, partial [Mycobacteriales bacterium]